MTDHAEPLAVTIILNETEVPGERINRLLPLVYAQLRAAAQLEMGAERSGHTLSATALVHEAYIKLVGPRDVAWQDRGHFYAAAAEAMRQILLDHAKGRARLKRGGGQVQQNLGMKDAAELPTIDRDGEDDDFADFVALDAAMRRLEGRDPRMAQVVRLKYYAGLEIAQVALALGVSERTVKNDWAFAKAWLERELGSRTAGEPERDRDDRKLP